MDNLLSPVQVTYPGYPGHYPSAVISSCGCLEGVCNTRYLYEYPEWESGQEGLITFMLLRAHSNYGKVCFAKHPSIFVIV